MFSYWRVAPLEFFIWLAAVLVTIFSSIENGIYTSVIASIVLLLLRIARPRGAFLGRVTIHADAPSKSDPKEARDVFVPLKNNGIINREIEVTPPAPGVIIYRFEESLLFPNCSLLNSTLVDYVKENMRRGKDMSLVPLHDRPWNDPGPRRGDRGQEQSENEKRPVLHAIVLDFSTM